MNLNPPLLVLLRVRIIFLRPPPPPCTGPGQAHPDCPPPLVLLRVRIIFLRPPPTPPSPIPLQIWFLKPPPLVLLRFEHRFAIFVLYITKIKKLNYILKYI
jgi:hypothetical protein